MAKRTRNPQRSLEMVVDAPMQDCIHALNHLRSGHLFSSEMIRTTVFRDRHQDNEFRFEVIFHLGKGSSRRVTTVQGTLQYDEFYHTTMIVWELDAYSDTVIKRFVFPVALFGSFLLITQLILSVSFNSGLGILFIVLIASIVNAIPIMSSSYLQYLDDTSHLISIVEKAIKEKSNGKTHT